MPDGSDQLSIANTISALIEGDVNAHLPLEAIRPLCHQGRVVESPIYGVCRELEVSV